MSFFPLRIHQNRWEKLQRSPDPQAGFKGAASRQDRNGGEGRTGGGRGKGREKGEWVREGKGEVGGIAPWLLGG